MVRHFLRMGQSHVLLFHNHLQQIAVVVSPVDVFRRFTIPVGGVLVQFKILEKGFVAGDQNPVGVVDVPCPDFRVTLDPNDFVAEICREIANRITEIEVKVRDVNREDAVGFQMLEIQFKGFFREEVDRNRIATESIDKQDIEILSDWLYN